MIKIREEVYKLYWYFATERQNIFFKKLNNEPMPWTEDYIFEEYKFCNAYRASDRVSQYLIKNVIYVDDDFSYEDTIFRIVLFKLFNKIDTWKLIDKEIGKITLKNFSVEIYSDVLKRAMENDVKIYTDAYMSCANKAFGFDKKHENHMALLHKMFIKDKIQHKIVKSKNMEEAFNIIREYPLIGDFMAYQLVTDINYSEVTDFSERSFTVVGPGSERGIQKCFIDTDGKSKEYLIKWMCENQDKEFERYGLEFKNLWGRPLQYIDCQNLLCETDKYCRQAVPELKTNRIRIKKRYTPMNEKIEYFYPPKWGINDKIRLN